MSKFNLKIQINVYYNLPILGMAMCIKCACSSCALFSSCWSPSRSFVRTSCGTLHPHPFKSANLVSRKVGSKSCATGSNGLRRARALGLPPNSSCATDNASCATDVACTSIAGWYEAMLAKMFGGILETLKILKLSASLPTLSEQNMANNYRLTGKIPRKRKVRSESTD